MNVFSSPALDAGCEPEQPLLSEGAAKTENGTFDISKIYFYSFEEIEEKEEMKKEEQAEPEQEVGKNHTHTHTLKWGTDDVTLT